MAGRAEHDTAHQEEVLSRLRDAAKACGVADRFSANDERRQSTVFGKLYTRGEAPHELQAFYPAQKTPSPEPWRPGPQWVKFHTEDRLAWVRHLPELLQALQGLPVSVNKSISWRWGHSRPRANGRPSYVPVYEAMVCLNAKETERFDARQALPSLLESVCHLDHPLADMNLFDWQEDQVGRVLFPNYRWRPDGREATFFEKARLDEALEKLFSGHQTHVERKGQGSDRHWVLTVTLSP